MKNFVKIRSQLIILPVQRFRNGNKSCRNFQRTQRNFANATSCVPRALTNWQVLVISRFFHWRASSAAQQQHQSGHSATFFFSLVFCLFNTHLEGPLPSAAPPVLCHQRTDRECWGSSWLFPFRCCPFCRSRTWRTPSSVLEQTPLFHYRSWRRAAPITTRRKITAFINRSGLLIRPPVTNRGYHRARNTTAYIYVHKVMCKRNEVGVRRYLRFTCSSSSASAWNNQNKRKS